MTHRALIFSLVVAMLATGCARGIDQQKFAGVYRAGQDMRGATGVGVTLIRYRELLGAFASQVAQATDLATSDRERQMVSAYASAESCYKDAATIWAMKLEHSTSLDFLYVDDLPGADALIKKYNLTTHPTQFRPDLQAINPDQAIQEIWDRAAQSLAMANTAYTGKSQS